MEVPQHDLGAVRRNAFQLSLILYDHLLDKLEGVLKNMLSGQNLVRKTRGGWEKLPSGLPPAKPLG